VEPAAARRATLAPRENAVHQVSVASKARARSVNLACSNAAAVAALRGPRVVEKAAAVVTRFAVGDQSLLRCAAAQAASAVAVAAACQACTATPAMVCAGTGLDAGCCRGTKPQCCLNSSGSPYCCEAGTSCTYTVNGSEFACCPLGLGES
jgi:hypothetical protein